MNDSFMGKIGKLLNILSTAVLMNACFLICCLPIVTIGPAWNGLLTAIRYHVRGDKWFAGFKFGFKTRFWRSFLSFNIMLLPILYFLPEVNHHWQTEQLVPLIFSVLVFMLLAMFSSALQLLNVYIPTPVGRWIRNAGDLMKSGHLKLAALAAAFWAPLILFLMEPDIFFLIVIVFMIAYYMIVGLGTTLLLKANLIDFLVDARADGVLLAEEGRAKNQSEETEEE